jgi:hypothetical protein
MHFLVFQTARSFRPAPSQPMARMPLVVAKDKEMDVAIIFLEKKMIRKRTQRSPPEPIVCKMKTLWILRHLLHGYFHLIEEPIT